MQLQKAVVDSLYLFNQSPDHRLLTLVDFNHFLIFPLTNGKARLFYDEDRPIGLVTWAWLTSEESAALLADSFMPSESVFQRDISDELWGLDFIAPFNPGRPVIRMMMKDTYQAATSHLSQDFKVHWRRFKQPSCRHTRRL